MAVSPADANSDVSIIDLPEELLPAHTNVVPPDEHWLPLQGEVGSEIDALARAALGDVMPPPVVEPDLSFDFVHEEAPADAVEATADSVLSEPEQETAEVAAPAKVAPAKEAAISEEEPKAGRLAVACPNCSTNGVIPWDRLGGVLCCSGCWKWFRVGENGQLAQVDPPPGSRGALRLYAEDGSERTVTLKPRLLDEKRCAARMSPVRVWIGDAVGRLRFGLILRAVLPIALMAVIIYVGVRWWSKPRLAKLPQELDQRAQLLVESWLKSDHSTMARLTHPNYPGATRRWAFEHRSPLSPGQFDRRRIPLQVRVLAQDESSAETEVSISLAGVTGASDPVVMQQRWECLNGTWVFKPGNDPPHTPRTPEPASQSGKQRR